MSEINLLTNGLLEDLEYRGLIHQMTDREGDEKLQNDRVVLIAASIRRLTAFISAFATDPMSCAVPKGRSYTAWHWLAEVQA